jgi:predicted amidophosphoribosyltransferase
LERVKPTLQQARLTKNQRKKNLEKAFVLKNSVQVKGKNIFVFDDVWTTGFTLKSAAKELKKAGADKVLALSFARSH